MTTNKCPTCGQIIKKRFVRPTPEMVTQYAESIGFKLDGEAFCQPRIYQNKPSQRLR